MAGPEFVSEPKSKIVHAPATEPQGALKSPALSGNELEMALTPTPKANKKYAKPLHRPRNLSNVDHANKEEGPTYDIKRQRRVSSRDRKGRQAHLYGNILKGGATAEKQADAYKAGLTLIESNARAVFDTLELAWATTMAAYSEAWMNMKHVMEGEADGAWALAARGVVDGLRSGGIGFVAKALATGTGGLASILGSALSFAVGGMGNVKRDKSPGVLFKPPGVLAPKGSLFIKQDRAGVSEMTNRLRNEQSDHKGTVNTVMILQVVGARFAQIRTDAETSIALASTRTLEVRLWKSYLKAKAPRSLMGNRYIPESVLLHFKTAHGLDPKATYALMDMEWSDLTGTTWKVEWAKKGTK